MKKLTFLFLFLTTLGYSSFAYCGEDSSATLCCTVDQLCVLTECCDGREIPSNPTDPRTEKDGVCPRSFGSGSSSGATYFSHVKIIDGQCCLAYGYVAKTKNGKKVSACKPTQKEAVDDFKTLNNGNGN